MLLKNLSKQYKGRRHSVTALSNVNLSLTEKGLVFVVGKSGSGKSTLLNLLGGIDYPTNGEIILNQQSFKNFNEKDYNSYRNTYVGFVFQNCNLINEFTVKENIEIALHLQKKSVTLKDIEEVLEKVELGGLANRKVNELSGGQMQRVAIGRALIKDPKLIIADEPTGNLDTETSKQIFNLLKSLSKDRLVVVVSHDIEYANTYCDQLIEIEDGKIKKSSTINGKYSDKTSVYKTTRKGISLKHAFKLGLRGFRRKFIRMLLTILLSLFSLFFFASTLLYNNTDEKTIWLKNIPRANLDYAIIENPNSDYDMYTYDEVMHIYDTYSDLSPSVVVDQAIYLDEVYGDTGDTFHYYSNLIRSYIELNENNQAYFENKLSGNSRLPQKTNEMVITSYLAESFIEYGYKDEYGQRIKITTPEDMIGKTINYQDYGLGIYTIVGIIDVETSKYHEFKIADDFNPTSAADIYNYGNLRKDFSAVLPHYLDYALVYQDWVKTTDGYDYYQQYKLMINLPKDEKKIANLKYNQGDIRLVTPLDETIEDLTAQIKNTKQIFMTISIMFGAYAFFQLFNFVKLSVRDDIKEIGILRAIGASGVDIGKIYISQSILFMIVIGILNIFITFFAQYIDNYLINIYPYYVMGEVFKYEVVSSSFNTIFTIILLSLIAVLVATIIPVYRASLLKPVDALKKEK